MQLHPDEEEQWEGEEADVPQGDEYDEDEDDYEEDYEEAYDDPADLSVSHARGGGGKKARREEIEVGGWNRNLFCDPAQFAARKADLIRQVKEWRLNGKAEKAIARKPIQALLPDIMAYLLASYRRLVETRSDVRHGKLRLQFGDGQEVHCIPATGEVRFGWGILTGRIDDKAISRYALEQQPMKAVCRGKEDVLMWLVLHEFLHLFVGNEAHTSDFFAKITGAAKEHSFLFSNISAP